MDCYSDGYPFNNGYVYAYSQQFDYAFGYAHCKPDFYSVPDLDLQFYFYRDRYLYQYLHSQQFGYAFGYAFGFAHCKRDFNPEQDPDAERDLI
jgi:hypothetical protein